MILAVPGSPRICPSPSRFLYALGGADGLRGLACWSLGDLPAHCLDRAWDWAGVKSAAAAALANLDPEALLKMFQSQGEKPRAVPNPENRCSTALCSRLQACLVREPRNDVRGLRP